MWDTHRVVPFVPPTAQQRKSALGSLAGQNWVIKKSILSILDLFIPMGPSKPDDWLHQYQQDGQPFQLYKSLDKKHIQFTQVYYNVTQQNNNINLQKIKHKLFSMAVKQKYQKQQILIQKRCNLYNPNKVIHFIMEDQSIVTQYLNYRKMDIR